MLRIAILSFAIACGLSSAQEIAEKPKREFVIPVLAPLPAVEAVTEAELTAAIGKGADFLIADQNPNGSWGGPTRTKGLNIFAPVPEAHLAFRAGASALALAGLIDSGDRRPETESAIAKAEKWMFSELPKLRQMNPMACYSVWGHAYGLRALAALSRYHAGDAEKQKALLALANDQVARLMKVEQVNGGWGYVDLDWQTTAQPSGMSTCFTTATCLLALREAHDTLGSDLPERQIKRALHSIEQQRTGDWAFVYSLDHRFRPRYGINRPAGSLGRSHSCGMAMKKFGDERITDDLVELWLHRLCLREGWLSMARKRPVPHDLHFSISGYFYYYGFYYATESLLSLPKEKRGKYLPTLARHILSKQEKDGSWWDYPLYDYHQPYGTGYSLTILSRLRGEL